jgi:DNA-binding FadR family transcriptional regulator
MTNKHESMGAPHDAIFTALYLGAEQTRLPHEPSYDVERGLQRFSTWLDDDHARTSAAAATRPLGRLIVTSRPGYGPGQVISLEMVSGEAEVSRAMAREVLQVLHHKRLVGLQPRVGATVLPVEQWDVFDPDVIKWRLDAAPRFQMRSLTELRQAIEPAAASLAAQCASADVCRDLVALSLQLQELGENLGFSEDSPAGERIRAD